MFFAINTMYINTIYKLNWVDHLASSIEEQWETEPELNFDEALKKLLVKIWHIRVQQSKTTKRKRT